MADNYVKPIARAIRALDNNKYTLDYYMGFGWDGLRTFGYAGYKDKGKWVSLDKGKDTEYYKKQAIVLRNTNFNKNCN
ncbi:hypothetical protein [Polaribacter sp. IC073]|uniref:hypothetical protein n=1 Tax=Polaribacter sp. IC073 TaxID=2508540 RepID=UPI0011BEC3F3|nr:hypothetical protein [Polaribacter sp. IC073]TXD50001.1 hypothetical protein ES045_02130 [Polaribacter sp. IC073]